MSGIAIDTTVVAAAPAEVEEEHSCHRNHIHEFLDGIGVASYCDPTKLLHIEASKSADAALKLMAGAGVTEAHIYDDAADAVCDPLLRGDSPETSATVVQTVFPCVCF